MKGVVFCEFLEMTRERFGTHVLDQVVARAGRTTRGAYSAIGTYDHAEFLHLVFRLAAHTGSDRSEILHTFGRRLFTRFAEAYPHFVNRVRTAPDFLEMLEETVPSEFQQLCHETELPEIRHRRIDAQTLVIEYRSTRPLAGLAEGMIRGCCDYFGHPYTLRRQERAAETETSASFELTCASRAEACKTLNP